MLSVMLPSHNLEPLVTFLKLRHVANYQIVINQGSCLRQFRYAIQVRLRQEADLDACLNPAAHTFDPDDFEIDLPESPS
jgi:hypothetical protein